MSAFLQFLRIWFDFCKISGWKVSFFGVCSVCIPVERYCDRVIDCPEGTDEADCSCTDWDMHECSIGKASMAAEAHYLK